jgi:hypothetical protein
MIQILCRKWASKSLVYICVHWNVKTLSLTPNTLFHAIEHFILNGQRTFFSLTGRSVKGLHLISGKCLAVWSQALL